MRQARFVRGKKARPGKLGRPDAKSQMAPADDLWAGHATEHAVSKSMTAHLIHSAARALQITSMLYQRQG